MTASEPVVKDVNFDAGGPGRSGHRQCALRCGRLRRCGVLKQDEALGALDVVTSWAEDLWSVASSVTVAGDPPRTRWPVAAHAPSALELRDAKVAASLQTGKAADLWRPSGGESTTCGAEGVSPPACSSAKRPAAEPSPTPQIGPGTCAQAQESSPPTDWRVGVVASVAASLSEPRSAPLAQGAPESRRELQQPAPARFFSAAP